MLVLIDGKEVKVLNDIKIIVEAGSDDDYDRQLHLTLTHEGLITDVFQAEKGEPLQPSDTDSEMYDEVVERLKSFYAADRY
jgi:hypothetical protein